MAIGHKTTFDEDDTKVQMTGPRVLQIGKHLPPEHWDAESVGIMRFSGPVPGLLRGVLEEVAADRGSRQRLFLDAIQRLIDTGLAVHGCDVSGLPWVDVDTPEDLAQVQRHPERYVASADASQGLVGRPA